MGINASIYDKTTWFDDDDDDHLSLLSDTTNESSTVNRASVPQSPVRLHYGSYTVAWICALSIEMAAAIAMLDRIHHSLPPTGRDSNSYILGSIGEHNVVVACLPADHYGTNSAAVVASNLIRTFPAIRTGLMVGIGGGVPGHVDVRLGDVVVGYRVVQHDLGKVVEGSRVHRTGIQKTPPSGLLAAISKLRAIHESTLSQVPSFLREMLTLYPRMTKYVYPGLSHDRLFHSAYSHDPEMAGCEGCDTSMLISRPLRMDNNPVIHYGGIASGNQVMRDSISRDKIAQELNVICFEMEAAGLVDILPSLVIRGICDYSDSHKNKEWQEYAAATAAAYAKELLVTAIPCAMVNECMPPHNSSCAGSEATPAMLQAMDPQWVMSHMPKSMRIPLEQQRFYKQLSFSTILVIDSRGRYLPFYLETIDSKELFMEILKHRFKDLGTKKIERGEWILEYQHNGQRLDLSKDWKSIVKPNRVLRMSTIFRRQNEGSTECPSCSFVNPGLSSDLIQCNRCSLSYRRIEEVRDIQIGDNPANVQAQPALAMRANISARFQRPRPPKLQSPEDDIGRYKHIHLVDVDFNIGTTRIGQGIMETALQLGPNDLADTECLAETLAHAYGLSETDSRALSLRIGSQNYPINYSQTPSPRIGPQEDIVNYSQALSLTTGSQEDIVNYSQIWAWLSSITSDVDATDDFTEIPIIRTTPTSKRTSKRHTGSKSGPGASTESCDPKTGDDLAAIFASAKTAYAKKKQELKQEREQERKLRAKQKRVNRVHNETRSEAEIRPLRPVKGSLLQELFRKRKERDLANKRNEGDKAEVDIDLAKKLNEEDKAEADKDLANELDEKDKAEADKDVLLNK